CGVSCRIRSLCPQPRRRIRTEARAEHVLRRQGACAFGPPGTARGTRHGAGAKRSARIRAGQPGAGTGKPSSAARACDRGRAAGTC
ncbi:hypothetical protein, partial [Cupriavidus taiwanensis]|uniref:hypothetical protein n=1 Tax=Cupriavidus taiwanensis TaxID=164546 RepID=UPI0039E8BD1E